MGLHYTMRVQVPSPLSRDLHFFSGFCWYIYIWGLGIRAQVRNNQVLGCRVIGVLVQVFGKYLTMRYLHH